MNRPTNPIDWLLPGRRVPQVDGPRPLSDETVQAKGAQHGHRTDSNVIDQPSTSHRRRDGRDRGDGSHAARDRRQRADARQRRRSPSVGRLRSWGGRFGTQRVRRVDRSVADRAVVAGHRHGRQWRAVLVHRRSLRRHVAGAGRPEQLPGCRLLRDGGRRRRRISGPTTRPSGVERQRDGPGCRTDVGLRWRPGCALRHRLVRAVRRGLRRMAAAVAVRRRRVHPPPASGRELRRQDVPRRRQPERGCRRAQARTRHRCRERNRRRVLGPAKRLRNGATPCHGCRNPARGGRGPPPDGVVDAGGHGACRTRQPCRRGARNRRHRQTGRVHPDRSDVRHWDRRRPHGRRHGKRRSDRRHGRRHRPMECSGRARLADDGHGGSVGRRRTLRHRGEPSGRRRHRRFRCCPVHRERRRGHLGACVPYASSNRRCGAVLGHRHPGPGHLDRESAIGVGTRGGRPTASAAAAATATTTATTTTTTTSTTIHRPRSSERSPYAKCSMRSTCRDHATCPVSSST